MAQNASPAVAEKRRRSPVRVFLWIVGILLLLVVVAYFALTSTAFLKAVILPRVSQTLNAQVTVNDASIHPFSSVTLRGLRVTTSEPEPLLSADTAHVTYRLLDILRGKTRIGEFTVLAPVIHVVEHADGRTSLDPILQRPKAEPGKAPEKEKGEPSELAIGKISLQNGTVRRVKHYAGPRVELLELTGVNFTGTDIGNARTGALALEFQLGFNQGFAGPSNGVLHVTARGQHQLTLDQDLKPASVTGQTRFEITRAEGSFRDVANLTTVMEANVTPSEIKQAAVTFTRSGQSLGSISATGPFDASGPSGKLQLLIQSLDRNVLNLVGAPFGVDFGGTQLNSTNMLELAPGLVRVNGQLLGNRFAVTRLGQTTPTLDLQALYSVSLDQSNQTALIQNFNFTAQQDAKPLLQAALAKPMLLDFAKRSNAVDESALTLTVTNLNLTDWRPFLGDNVSQGLLQANLNLLSRQAGKQLEVRLTAGIANLNAALPSNKIENATVALDLRADLAEFNRLHLAQTKLHLEQQGAPVFSANATGQVELASQEADLQTEFTTSLADLLRVFPQPGASFSAGTIHFAGRLAQKNLAPARTNNPAFDRSVTGRLQVTNLTGSHGDLRFDRFETVLDLDASQREHLATLRKFTGLLRQGGQPGGTLDLQGNYDLEAKRGDLTLKVADLNQVTMQSAAALLGERKLESVTLNANTVARYDAKGASSASGQVSVANLLITDPAGQLPRVPMTAEFKLDAAISARGVAELKQLTGTIRQGETRGGNFDLTGQYDLTNQTGQIALKLTDLNQHALKPFLASSLGDKSLESISISLEANGRYATQGDSALKASLQVTNLLVKDPAGTFGNTPLAAGLKLDAAATNKVVELRQAQLALTPTSRARNLLDLTGKVDLTRSNAISGQLKLASDALDVTPYYDLLATSKPTNTVAETTPPASPTPAPPTTASNTEPAAVDLPLDKFVAEANIARFYLRQIAITNLVATARIEDDKIDVKPIKLIVNGGTVDARTWFNLGVPGYQYDLGVAIENVPAEPFALSFADVKPGQYQGTVLANAAIKGAGVTGSSLQKHLTGNATLTFTNANIQLIGQKTKKYLTPIAFALRLQDLLQSPLNWFSVKTDIGNGKIALNPLTIQSEAFQASATGTVTIAEVLTNSPINQIPVEIALRRSLAQKANLLPANAPTNTPYVSLPTFVTVAGTVGEPEVRTDKLKLAAILAGSAAGIVPGEARDILQGVQGLLGGDRSSTTQTNQATNAPAANVLTNIGGLLFPPRSPETTNAPAQPTPPKTNRFRLFDLVPR